MPSPDRPAEHPTGDQTSVRPTEDHNSGHTSARTAERAWTPDRVTPLGLTWRIALAGSLGLFTWGLVVTLASADPAGGHVSSSLRYLVFDPIVGILTLIAVARYRRRHPMATATAATVVSVVAISAAGASVWAICSVATRRRPRELAFLAVVVTFATMVGTYFVAPSGSPGIGPWWFELLFAVLVAAVNLSIGYAVGSRRALVRSWVDRARTTEAEQRARVAAAQAAERTRIAREMHDVLAHRISLVALHAGALRYRTDLPEAERTQAVDVIALNAEQALADLRAVLGVLRDPNTLSSAAQVEPPQPDLPQIFRLIEDAQAAGERIDLIDELDDEVPGPVGRAAYRIIQEALTNARKHAPRTKVVVTLSGAPREGLSISITNPRPVNPPTPLPSSGLGLLGLRERVELLDGRLRHGPTPDGGHTLSAWLPWDP